MQYLEWDTYVEDDEFTPKNKKVTSRQKAMAKQETQSTGKRVDPLKVARRRHRETTEDDA